MRRIGFERNEEVEDAIERAVKNQDYVVVYLRGQSRTFSGLARRILGDNLILRPYLGTDYTSGTPRQVLIDKDTPCRIDDISAMEPIEFDNFMAYCNYVNKTREEANTKTELKTDKKESEQ